MTATTTARGSASFERVIGRVRGDAPGPTLIICGGMHGNEPAGVLAARAVLEGLRSPGQALSGTCLCLAGNLQALDENQRFLAHDLNRAWTSEKIDALLRRDASADVPEEREQRELIRLFEEERGRARGPVVIVDLHTTSAGGPPFTIFSDTLDNRRIAMRLGIPAIMGLEECIDGTMLDYATKAGVISFVVEGGQHADPASVRSLEAALWLTLDALGMIDAPPPATRAREILAEAARGLPRALDVRHRHPVHAGDGFRMEPGYEGFQRIRKGELLARDNSGEVRARGTGRILMPLYQSQGEDGFFLIREISGFWLGVSTIARRLGVPRLVPAFPGVDRHPERADWIGVHPRVVRFFRREVFHLLGYRTREVWPDRVVFARRRRRPIELP